MDYDTDKIDDAVLALLMLTVHRQDEYGARAWKGHDWDAMERLHEKGFIGDPASKAKSVFVTPEGLAQGGGLFEKLFSKDQQKAVGDDRGSGSRAGATWQTGGHAAQAALDAMECALNPHGSHGGRP